MHIAASFGYFIEYIMMHGIINTKYSYTSTPPMGRTACTEPQCLYKGDNYLFFTIKAYGGSGMVELQVLLFFSL